MSRQLDQEKASHWNPNDYSWSPQRLYASEIENNEKVEPHRELVTEPVPRNGQQKRCKQVKRVKLPESADVICEVPFCSHICVGKYYKKYRVCIEHAKAQSVSITGIAARFCQKCAKFHPVSSFDGRNKSCRVTLYEHNRRRRLQNSKVDPLKATSTKVSKGGKHAARKPSVRDLDSNYKNNKRGVQEEYAEVREPIERLASDEATHNTVSTEILSMDESGDLLLDSDIPEVDIKPYKAEEVQVDLGLKFEGRTPSDLPINIVDDILNEMPSTGWIEGSVRPGCTHVTATLRLKRQDYGKVVSSDQEFALQNAFEKLWNGTKGITGGLKVRVPVLGLSKQPVSMSCCCARMQPGPVTVDFYGHDIHDPMMVAFCRQNGKYLTTTILGSDCESIVDDFSEEELSDDSEVSDAGSHRSILDKYPESVQSEDGCALQRKSVQILGLDVGSCEIDLVLEDSVMHSFSLLILPPSAVGAEEEIQRLTAGNRSEPWVKNFTRDVGMVLRHLYGRDPLAECHLEMIQRLASQTVEYCLERSSVELARLLQPAIPEKDSVCRPLKERTNNETEKRDSPQLKKVGRGDHQGLYAESLHAELTKNLLEDVSKTNIGAMWLDYGWENVFMQMMFGFGILVFSAILVLSDAS